MRFVIRSAMMQSPSRVPAYIVTGFLGVGKTTLLRALITGASGKRLP